MLTLFEVLSFKGWLDVRDILIKALGPVSSHSMKYDCVYELFRIGIECEFLFLFLFCFLIFAWLLFFESVLRDEYEKTVFFSDAIQRCRRSMNIYL